MTKPRTTEMPTTAASEPQAIRGQELASRNGPVSLFIGVLLRCSSMRHIVDGSRMRFEVKELSDRISVRYYHINEQERVPQREAVQGYWDPRRRAHCKRIAQRHACRSRAEM